MDAATGIRIGLDDLSTFGSDLSRPECILAFASGELIISNAEGLLSCYDRAGRRHDFGAKHELPNGLAIAPDGQILISDIGECAVYAMGEDGIEKLLFDQYDDAPLGSVNFPYTDPTGQLWLTVSTRTIPRRSAIGNPVADGYLLKLDADLRPTKVLDNIHFPNEVRLDPDRGVLYMAETSAGQVTKYDLDADGNPVNPRPHGPAPLFPGALVDGITLDVEGGLWVTEITRHAIIRIAPDGTATTVIEDPECRVLSHPTSLTFAGPDLQTAYIGSLDLPHLVTFRSPIAGVPMYHWDKPVPLVGNQPAD
ncbi:MAG: SMP-30/gluconolactonase/LRE family protein [Paracoccaceae bacterium]